MIVIIVLCLCCTLTIVFKERVKKFVENSPCATCFNLGPQNHEPDSENNVQMQQPNTVDRGLSANFRSYQNSSLQGGTASGASIDPGSFKTPSSISQ